MPVIKPRTTQKVWIRHTTRLFRENNETLYAYARFIGEPTDYVLNQLIDSVLSRDREFQQWRAAHPESQVGTRNATQPETRGPLKHPRTTATPDDQPSQSEPAPPNQSERD